MVTLLSCQGGNSWQGGGNGLDSGERNQIGNVVRFISEVQLYLNSKENSKSRSLLLLPCSLDRIRGLKGVCRNLTKHKVPNALHRLNQFFTKRKKYESKNKEAILRKKIKEDNFISENVIEDSLEENDTKQQHFTSAETTTKVVFLHFSDVTTDSATPPEQDQDDQSNWNNDVDSDGEASGEYDLSTEVITDGVDAVTDQPEQEGSTEADFIEGVKENPSDFEKISLEEEFLINLDVEVDDIFESSGDSESLEVNFP